MYTIGIDFGTESGRALLVDTRDGRELASAVLKYAHGVIDERLPTSGSALPLDWALQDPLDYLDVIKTTVPAVLRDSGINPAEVVGVGIDFTTCTLIPTLADGTPLRALPEWERNPHAWPKLWKHHGSQPQADKINALAAERGESWLKRYSGKTSSEWFFAKALQILEEAPEVYSAADRLIEAGDWIVWRMTGVETHNACMAGYKAFFQDGRYPSKAFFEALNPAFADVVETKLIPNVIQLGDLAGYLNAEFAALTGLREGTAVAAAIGDAHAFVPASKVTRPGVMGLIMGTSICQLMSGETLYDMQGLAGIVDGGLVKGLIGYEAGQTGGGDIYAWFVQHAVPPSYHEAARTAGVSLYELLEHDAATQQIGEHGLIALDWWSGNRSTLMDADLSGMLVGMTLGTRAPDIYRALIEATAFGTRMIIDAFQSQGLQVKELIAGGGMPEKNGLLRQIYADVTGLSFKLSGSPYASALGTAMYAAVAAGVYPDIHAAADVMGKVKDEMVTQPIAANQARYDALYDEYKTLYEYFGRENGVMRRLKTIKRAARA